MARPTKDADLNGLTAPHVHRSPPRNREIRECFSQSARAAIGDIEPGCEIFGFTKGQFSLMDVIVALLEQTGPASVTLSTWTAGNVDVGHAYNLLENRTLTDMRWIIDRSFPARQPMYYATLLKRFGPESVRITRTHAKFALIENDTWNIALRSSMNLNRNIRFENFEISDDPALAGYLRTVTDEIFSTPSLGRVPTNKEVDEAFQALSVKGPPADDLTAQLTALRN